MFTRIKTSKANKDIITRLTRELNLGKENVIARMAFMHSISQNKKLQLEDIQDSDGKEYSRSVLFGDYEDIYVGILCVNYNIDRTHLEIGKYAKLHVDDGLQLLQTDMKLNSGISNFDITFL